MIDDVFNTLNRENRTEGDYFGPDGLLYCGSCGKPKQTRLEGFPGPVYISCSCMEAAQAAADERERQKQIEDLRAYCLPSGLIRNHTFAVAEPEKHIERAKRFVDNWEEVKRRNLGIVFYGPVGTGKSFAAHCIANALIDKGIPVRYLSAVDLVAAMMDNSKREAVLSGLTTVPLLIIDDLGAEHDSAYSRSQICSVIDSRVESGKPLIITTNYSLREMQRSPDHTLARTFDRILSACVPVAVSGESRRKQQAAANLRAAKELLDL